MFFITNPGMVAITGYSAEELLGCLSGSRSIRMNRAGAAAGEARRRGEVVPDRYVLKLLHKDGRVIYTDFITAR